MDDVVAPVFHEYVPPPVAVSVTFAPGQTVVLPVILAVALLLTVMVPVAEEEQVPTVTYAVYMEVEVGETVIEEVVAPVLQE